MRAVEAKVDQSTPNGLSIKLLERMNIVLGQIEHCVSEMTTARLKQDKADLLIQITNDRHSLHLIHEELCNSASIEGTFNRDSMFDSLIKVELVK